MDGPAATASVGTAAPASSVTLSGVAAQVPGTSAPPAASAGGPVAGAVGLAALPGPPGPVVSGRTSYTALPGTPENLQAEKEAYRELRRRARAACRICGLRKVRCDVTKQAFGEPCTNCRRDGLTCAVMPRKKHRPRRPNGTFDHGPASISPLDGRDGSGAAGSGGDGSYSPEPGAWPDEEERVADGDAKPQSTTTTTSSTSSAWHPHQMAYLSHLGALTPPYSDLLDELMRVYFAHVHFFLPLVDAAEFAHSYTACGWNGIPPLLGWSMCLAATSFVRDDDAVMSRANYATPTELKAAMYARAKSLFDLDKAADTVTRIQSALLLGFTYTGADDHTDAWHWTGVAISLAQSLGFHRRRPRPCIDPDTPRDEQDRRTRTARRIWWTCVLRDRWVALKMGRPMSIHDEDCDVPRPVLEDLMQGYSAAYGAGTDSEILLPPDQAAECSLAWLRLVTTSSLLGRIVRALYRVHGPRPLQRDIDALEEELVQCRPPEDDQEVVSQGQHGDVDGMDYTLLHKHQADLFYYATATVLYRPCVLQVPSAGCADAAQQWYTTAAQRGRDAAASTTDALHRLLEMGGVHQLQPMTVAALVPAMQVHLVDCKAASPLLRYNAKNKLQQCLSVLSEMRHVCRGAGPVFRLFSEAQQMLEHAAVNGSPGPAPGSVTKTPLMKIKYEAAIMEPSPAADSSPPIPDRQDVASASPTGSLSSVLAPTASPVAPPNLAVAYTQELLLEPLPNPSWWNPSQSGDIVAQLLRHDFSLSDDVLQGLLQRCNNGAKAV